MSSKQPPGPTPYDPYVDTSLEPRSGSMAPDSGGFALLVSSAAGVAVVPLGDGRSMVIGRVPESDVVVPDPSVSRKHARLTFDEGVSLEDLGSSNGTTVSGRALEVGVRATIGVGTVFELGSATLVLQRARKDLEARRDVRVAAPTPDEALIVDPTMKRLYAMLDLIAPSALSVLVLGETGVGKEGYAQAIHRRSDRREAPFLQLNCAALPESILEGELFGYEKGAFTGATQAKAGLFEAATKGTVFLDEIGELSLSIQAKLLRAIESGQVTRLGALKPKQLDVRFVSATNRDLRKMMTEGTFRSDLYFRLNGVAITLPPLRKRRPSIVPLARMFAAKAAARGAKRAPTFTDAALAALEGHGWPGNVRELRNVMERAVVLSPHPELDARDLLLAGDEAFDGAEADVPDDGERTSAPIVDAVIRRSVPASPSPDDTAPLAARGEIA